MASSHIIAIFLFFSVLLCHGVQGVRSKNRCPQGFFAQRNRGITNKRFVTCEPCTKTCPEGEWVTRLCSNNGDMLCLPFAEIIKVPPWTQQEKPSHEGSVDGLFSMSDDSSTDTDGGSSSAKKTGNHPKVKVSSDHVKSGINATDGSAVETGNGEMDFFVTLCYSLIGALIAVTIVTLLCILASIIRGRKHPVAKGIAISDASNPGIYYRTVTIPMGQHEEEAAMTYQNTLHSDPEEPPSRARRFKQYLLHPSLIFSKKRTVHRMAVYQVNANHSGLMRLHILPEPIQNQDHLNSSTDSGICAISETSYSSLRQDV